MDDVWDDDDDGHLVVENPGTYMQKDLEKLQDVHSNVCPVGQGLNCRKVTRRAS